MAASHYKYSGRKTSNIEPNIAVLSSRWQILCCGSSPTG